MEDPIHEIPTVIHLLTQTPPHLQAAALNRFFIPTASFTHPFCRTGSYDVTYYFRYGFVQRTLKAIGMDGALEEVTTSRGLMGGIYRWYKILSPRIDMQVNSVAFDEKALLLYVSLHQDFRIPYIPFHNSPVNLVTVLTLITREDEEGKKKYLISAQNDLYQVNEFFKFFSVFRILWLGVLIWQFIATATCVIGQFVLRPIVWWEEGNLGPHNERRADVEVQEKRREIDGGTEDNSTTRGKGTNTA